MNSETIIAFARLAATLIVSACAAFGWAADGNLIANIVISALGVGCIGWSWWKNNNITEAAKEAQMLLDEIKMVERAHDTDNSDGESDAA